MSETRGEAAGLGGRRASDAPQAQLATMTLAIIPASEAQSATDVNGGANRRVSAAD
jgi:hypothetical protein